jgi:glycosyltransferase involved in cell wall biosynthesis
LKLCYLSGSQIPSRAANSVHVMKICEAFAAQGHSVTLFGKSSSVDEDPFAFYGVTARFELCLMPRLTGWRRKLRHRLWMAPKVRALRPDLLYGRSSRDLLALSGLGLPTVFEAHLPPTSSARREKIEQLFALPQFSRLVVISRALAEEYLREFDTLDPGRVLVAHDAASPAPLPAPTSDPRPASSARLQVGYTGHLYPGKGMETIAALATRCPWADFHVVGGMEDDLARWRPRVAGVTNLTLHGFVTHGEVGEHIRSFDVVLAPYGHVVSVKGDAAGAERWMSPLKIFEYMSYGKPVIATELPVICEVLESGKNALLAPADDLGAWERALRDLADDPRLRRTLGDRARNDFEAHYSWDKRARAVLEGLQLGGRSEGVTVR